MDDAILRTALRRLGELISTNRDVEILIVGGAAGVLTGVLPGEWTTGDVDMLRCDLPEDREIVMQAAEQVGRELSLPPSWFNEDSGLYAWTLPKGWRSRRKLVVERGRLRVYAVGRLDLLAMKFLAHRTTDFEHLDEMRITEEERNSIMVILDEMAQEHSGNQERSGRIAMARKELEDRT